MAKGGTGSTTEQGKKHSQGVIRSLQTTLKKTTADFMGVVKIRQQVLHSKHKNRLVARYGVYDRCMLACEQNVQKQNGRKEQLLGASSMQREF
eukprot:SAG31_NODE_11587_length_1015_cov_1.636463_2_plen_92_part_01